MLLNIPAFAKRKITINSGTGEPFVTENGGGFYGELVNELFSRLNIDAKVIPLPSARSMLNVNQGIDNVVIVSTKRMEQHYKIVSEYLEK